MSNIELSFENPWYLLLAIPAFAIILLPFFRLPVRRRKTFRKIAPAVLHMIVVTLLVLVISGFTVVENSDEQAVLLLVDLSDSTQTVQAEIENHAQQLLKLIDEKTPVGVIVFGQTKVYSVEFEDDRSFSVAKIDTDATDIDSALEYASTLLPTDRAGHIILLSDGKQTDGDALSTAQYLATRGIRIDAVYFDTTNLASDEVQISSFVSPDGAYVGDEMIFTADIESNTDAEITLTLYDGETQIAMLTQSVTAGSNVFELNCTAESSGMHAYRLVLETQSDTLAKNNESYAYVTVSGGAAVLVVADTIGNGEILAGLLAEDSEVTTVTARNAPKSIIALCDYDEVILSNVDYDQLLYSLPLSTTKIIVGKYMALLILYLIPLAVVCMYPLIFSQYGEVYLLTSYGSLLAYFIMGAALIAVGVFVSSLTENQGFAAGIGIAAILFNYFSVSLAEYATATAIGSAVVLFALAAVLGWIIYRLTKNSSLSWIVCLGLMAAVVASYWLIPEKLEGLIPEVMKNLSLFDRFETFVNGMFDLTAIVYFLSVIVFFLFLSVQSLEKRRYN